MVDEEQTQEVETEVIDNPNAVDRTNLNLQRFFDDMSMIGIQVKNNDIKKPTFFYGDLSVTNYLLWLLLAEIQMINNKNGEKDGRTNN